MAWMSLASKLTLGGGVLLLIDSFPSRQKVCLTWAAPSGLANVGSICAKATAWEATPAFWVASSWRCWPSC